MNNPLDTIHRPRFFLRVSRSRYYCTEGTQERAQGSLTEKRLRTTARLEQGDIVQWLFISLAEYSKLFSGRPRTAMLPFVAT